MVGLWIGAVALGVIVGLLASGARAWAAPVVVVVVLAYGAFCVRTLGLQAGMIALLIVTSVIDYYTFRVGPFDMRPEQVAALAALVALVVIRLREGSFQWLKPSLADGLLLAWFACSIVSSVLASPDRRLSAKIVALVAVCSLGFFLPRRLLAGPEAAGNLETVTRWLLIVFATEAAYGSFAYLIHVFGPTFSITPNPASGHLSAYGTLWEQNVFGGFTAAGMVAWVYLGKRRFRWAWLGVAACSGGLIDSLTRAAWLAAAIVGAVGLAIRDLRRRLDMSELGLAALGTAAILAATLVVDLVGRYTVQLSPGTGHGGGISKAVGNLVDIAGRLNQVGPVWNDLRGHLALGRGTASYEALHVIGGVPQHIASLPLLVLHDTGVAGLVLFVAFAAGVGVQVWSRRKNEIVSALGQVALVVVLANLATETTELMIGWLLIGLLVAAANFDRSAQT